ncbi:MAG: glycosyltransferase family 2 protein [Steroidobacteraceae bacterium]
MTAQLAGTPSVSVILPAFNRLKYLRPAVESVFVQTLADWELVIADDGSEEETRAYLRALASDTRVRVIWLPHSGNPAAVRNSAMGQARGEYLAFLDSDDEWLPTKLEKQIGSLRTCAGRRWSYTGSVSIDAKGESCAHAAAVPRHGGAILEFLLRHEVAIWTPTVVAERRLVAEAGGFDAALLLFEDYDLWLRLACRSEIDLIDEPLTRVRRFHDEHHSASERGASMLGSWHRALGKLRSLVAEPRLQSLVQRLFAQSTLDLASVRADTDRRAAARLLLGGCVHSWRRMNWWTGLARVLLKVAAPRAMLAFYRRSRSRRHPVTTRPSVTPPCR